MSSGMILKNPQRSLALAAAKGVMVSMMKLIEMDIVKNEAGRRD